MRWHNLIRQGHRWVSLFFMLTVAANFVAMALSPGGIPPVAVTYAPLPPLFLLMGSGLYLFVQPYFGKARAAASMDR